MTEFWTKCLLSAKNRKSLWLVAASLIWLMWLVGMVELWSLSEEYGHGLMVIGLLGYILYQRRQSMAVSSISNAWLSIPVALMALVFIVAGVASGISVVSMYGVMALTISAILVFAGTGLLKKLLVPLLIVWLLIPLPNPYGPMLTSGLQLISSQLGVWFIRMLGGVVYLEGNVIDMGGLQLLVAEACSGLRYLFPLMSLGAILGYMMYAPTWMRVTVFFVTVPITIILNSLRIGLTGLMAERWGLVYTQGFLHFFEGWVVFIFATLILLMIVWVMLKLAMPEKTVRDMLRFDAIAKIATKDEFHSGGIEKNDTLVWSVVSIALLTVSVATVLAFKPESVPHRDSLNNFPIALGDWRAREYRLPQETENVASASEYYYGDFTSQSDGVVNAYISFYETQLRGQIPHSPKVCIPGGGWQIENIRKVALVNRLGEHFWVNRLVITKGGHKQLTYYWLKQGDRMYSQEWVARLDLVRSSIVKSRTDGALIRLVSEIDPQQGEQKADERLTKFSQLLLGVLPKYVPD